MNDEDGVVVLLCNGGFQAGKCSLVKSLVLNCFMWLLFAGIFFSCFVLFLTYLGPTLHFLCS